MGRNTSWTSIFSLHLRLPHLFPPLAASPPCCSPSLIPPSLSSPSSTASRLLIPPCRFLACSCSHSPCRSHSLFHKTNSLSLPRCFNSRTIYPPTPNMLPLRPLPLFQMQPTTTTTAPQQRQRRQRRLQLLLLLVLQGQIINALRLLGQMQ